MENNFYGRILYGTTCVENIQVNPLQNSVMRKTLLMPG